MDRGAAPLHPPLHPDDPEIRIACKPGRKRLVVVGGGFGGLYTVRSLRDAPLNITLIDRTNHHLFQPLLYQVATAALAPSDIAVPIRAILTGQDNVAVLMEDVSAFDTEGREVRTASGAAFPYDWLVVAVGSRHSYFGRDDWEPLAPGLKTLGNALDIRDRILLAFERAEASQDQAEADRHMSFVVIGGGPTGVELSGAIAEISRQTMLRDFRHIDPSRTRVTLVEAHHRLLAAFPEKLSARARRDLEQLGVEVLTGGRVMGVDGRGVTVGDRVISASTVLWAAGNAASPLLRTLGVPLDHAGRVIVGPDLTVYGHPEVFVIGDAANAPGPGGDPLPGIAPVAIQQARYAAGIIWGGIPQPEREPFTYRDRGMLATIGKNRAVARIGRLLFGGRFAWLLWSLVHLMNIVVYENRFLVLIKWVISYATGQRGVRIISEPGGGTAPPPERPTSPHGSA